MQFRIGHGYDVHRLVEGRDLILCGVHVPHTLGLLGHSDADVAIHALCDALLGSLALGDIGMRFPDTDPRYKGVDSRLLLSDVMNVIRGEGWEILNVDITISAQKPKLRPFIDSMRGELAKVMGIGADSVSVKATTTEKLGFEGREEGISATAVTLVYRK